MTDDRTLLELAAIGRLAVAERAAWIARNAARAALRGFFKQYRHDTGEWFAVGEGEPEDDAVFYSLQEPSKAAQKALTKARAATRRAITRAAASLADTGEVK
jgi:hypothetical protein